MVLAMMTSSWGHAVHAEDLMTLLEEAKSKDAKYQSAYHKYLSTKENINISRADLLPTVSYQVENKTTDQTINSSDNAVFNAGAAKYPTDTTGLTVTQSLFDYSRWQRYAQSKIGANRAEAEYNLSKQQLLLRLAESYFLVLERGDQLETLASEKAAMLKHYESAELKNETGLVRKADVEDARARYLTVISKEVELQSRLVDSRYAVRESLGHMPGELSKLKADIKIEMPIPPSPEKWVERAAKNNLELQILELSLEEADKEIKALRGDHYPTLDLIYTSGNTVTEGSLFGGGSDIDTTEVMLQVNVPLYSGGKTSAQVRQAVENRYSIVEDHQDKRRNVERSAHDAYQRISEAVVQIDALHQSVQAQESRLKANSAGYTVGQNSLIEVLDVEQDLSLAKQRLIKARYDYLLNVLRLKYSVSGLTEADLVIVNGWLAGVTS